MHGVNTSLLSVMAALLVLSAVLQVSLTEKNHAIATLQRKNNQLTTHICELNANSGKFSVMNCYFQGY